MTNLQTPSFVRHTGIAAPFLQRDVEVEIIAPMTPDVHSLHHYPNIPAHAGLSAGQRSFEGLRYLPDVIDRPGMELISFRINPRLRNNLLLGSDDLDERLEHREGARAFRNENRNRQPWIYETGGGDSR